MFENHFGFIRRPFTAGPDVELFVDNQSARDAFESVEYCLRGGQGIAVLTAATGVGKTMFCQLMVTELRDEFTISFLPSPGSASTLGLLQAIYFGLGKRVKRRHGGISHSEMRLELIEAVRNIRVRSRGIVLLVDEAHLLDTEQLEEIRILSSFADRGQPLVRPLLCGNPELEERLLQPELKALSQRIRSQTYLETLTREESEHFIQHQVTRAGVSNRTIFEPAAIARIVAAADGVARCLNQLCDQSLFLAAANKQRTVTAEIVDQALETLIQLPLSWNQSLSSVTSHSVTSQPVAQPAESAIEFGSNRETGSVVEFGSLDDGPAFNPATPTEIFEQPLVSTPEPVPVPASESAVEFGPLATDEIIEAVDDPTDAIANEYILAEDDQPILAATSHGDELDETFRQGLPEAPVPYTETPILDRYGVSGHQPDSETQLFEPIDDFVGLKPRFDKPLVGQDLLPGSHNKPTEVSSARKFAEAAATTRRERIQDQWTEQDQTPAVAFGPAGEPDAAAEEELLQSCIETRHDIAVMLDTLESQVSESLADRYDVVMPPDQNENPEFGS
jgi:type II secretory pathway predicted ATPase ExeA